MSYILFDHVNGDNERKRKGTFMDHTQITHGRYFNDPLLWNLQTHMRPTGFVLWATSLKVWSPCIQSNHHSRWIQIRLALGRNHFSTYSSERRIFSDPLTTSNRHSRYCILRMRKAAETTELVLWQIRIFGKFLLEWFKLMGQHSRNPRKFKNEVQLILI